MNKPIFDRIVSEMAQIFAIEKNSVSPTANLFEMGLDSLMLLKLGQRLENIYGVTVDMGYFFTNLSTLEKIVDFVEQNASAPAAQPAPAAPSQPGSAAAPQQMPAPQPQFALPPASLPQGALLQGGKGQEVVSLFAQQIGFMQNIFHSQLEALGRLGVGAQAAGSAAMQMPQPALPAAGKPKDAAAVAAAQAQAQSIRRNVRGLKLEEDKFSPQQQKFVSELLSRHVSRTGKSREMMASYRDVLSDWKSTLSFRLSLKDAAYPIISAGSQGGHFRDVDGNEYIDIALGMGVHFLGHQNPDVMAAVRKQMDEGFELGPQCDLTGQAARGVAKLTGNERVSFCITGSEAVMMALRLARAHTGRNKVVMFSGSYHGIFDGVSVMRHGEEEAEAASPGTPPGMVEDMIILDYGSEDALNRIKQLSGQLAAVLVEPVQSRRPSLQPQTFLRKLRRLTREAGVTLIFDEMVNGFRIGAGGSQAHFGIRADIAIYGKIIGGGLPVGVIAGKADILDRVDGGQWRYGDMSKPETEMIVFGGTFCRHPLSMASVSAVTSLMERDGAQLHGRVNRMTERMADTLNRWFQLENVPLRMSYFGSQFKFDTYGQYSPLLQPIELDLFYMLMLERGVFTWERRTCFLSIAHTDADVEKIISAIKDSVQVLRQGGFTFAGGGPEWFRNLSSVERRLLAEMQSRAGQGAYHMPGAWIVSGALDLELLETAIGEVVRRHDILRTSYRIVNGEYVARIEDEPTFFLDRINAAGRDPGEIVKSYLRPFDLAKAPLLRVGVAELGADKHLLVIDALHVAMDGISLITFVNDLREAYGQAALPPSPPSYAEYSKFMEEFRSSPKAAAQLEYWGKALGGAGEFRFPLDKPKQAEAMPEAGHVRVDLESGFTAKLRQLAQKSGVTLFMALAAGYAHLLKTLGGVDDVCLGTVASGRPGGKFDNTLGMFVNTLALRFSSAKDMDVAAYLKQAKDICLGAYSHQDIPFELLAEKGFGALIQTMITYENADSRELRIGKCGMEQIKAEIPGSMFACSLDIIETGGVLHLDFEYDSNLILEETAKRWAGCFRRILEGFMDKPDAPLREVRPFDLAEEKKVLGFGRGPERGVSSACLHELFAAQALANPGLTAVVAPDGIFTYGELAAAADRIAAVVAGKLAADKRAVAVCMGRSKWFPAAVLGVLKAGGHYVPLAPDTPQARAAGIVAEAGAALLLANQESASACQNWGAEALVADQLPLASSAAQLLPVNQRYLAYILFTSGSTGKPKGVMVEHRAVVNLVTWLKREIYEPLGGRINEGMLAHFVFDVSVQHIFGSLLNGNTLHILPEHFAADGASLRRYLEKNPVDLLDMTPGQFMVLTEGGRNVDFGPVRHLNFGAEVLRPEVVRAIYASPKNAALTVRNMYGPTETCVQSTSCRVTLADADSGLPISIGQAIDNTNLYVLDNGNRPQGMGVFGELWIGGEGLACGYVGRPDLTQAVFVETEFGRLYRTGDRARWRADGSLEFAGRGDNQVKVMGHRIELGEIEQAALACPGLLNAAAVVLGEAERASLALYYSPAIEANALRQHLASLLPDYMVPRAMMGLERLPMTEGGKVDRRHLPAMGDLAKKTKAASRAFASPAERAIAAIWEKALGREGIGPEDSFFDLGGDSIKALQIVARMIEAGYEISVADILQSRSVAALAASAATATAAENESPAYAGEAKLSPMQSWFFAGQDKGRSHYNHALLFSASRLEPAAVESAAKELWARHDALRAVFALGKGGATQVIQHPENDSSIFASIDLRGRGDALAALAVDASARQAGFDLAKGPLFKVVLYRLDAGERLLFLAHHLVVDGVTWRVVIEDFCLAYKQAVSGTGMRLPRRTASFAAWTAEAAKLAEALENSADLGAWEEALQAAPIFPVADHDKYGNAATCALAADGITEAELSSLPASAFGGNAAELMLAAFLEAVRVEAKASQASVLLEGHGRELPGIKLDLSRSVGWFTNLWPVKFDLSGNADAFERLVAVKESARLAARHGHEYALLRYLSAGERGKRLQELPEPEFLFNYLGNFDDDESSLLKAAGEDVGKSISPDFRMNSALELDIMFVGGKLKLEATYIPRRVKAEAAQRLLDATVANARKFLDACRAVKTRVLTASSLSCQSMTQAELASFLAFNQFKPGEVEDVYPLTPAQEGMLFHARNHPESPAYFEQMWFDLDGRLDAEAFGNAWRGLALRHASLRTVFRDSEDGNPYQVALAQLEPAISQADISAKSDKDAAFAEAAKLERAHAFDFAHGPLLRCAIVKTGAGRQRVLVSYPHIISDGWCIGLMLSELVALYGQAVGAGEAALGQPAQYGKFVEKLLSADNDNGRGFWNKHLDSFAGRTSIAHTRGEAGFEMREHSLKLDRGLANEVKQAASASGVTLGAFFQAAWAAVLANHANSRDVGFGLVVSGRGLGLKGIEEMVGLCIQTLPARARLDQCPDFASLARQLQSAQVEMERHAGAALSNDKASRPGELFDHILVFENYPFDSTLAQRFAALGLTVANPGGFEEVEYGLSIEVNPGDDIAITFHYNQASYDSALICELGKQIQSMLGQAARNPQRSLDSFAMASANIAKVEVAGGFTPVTESIASLAEKDGALPCVSFGGKVFNRQELLAQASLAAAALKQNGVRLGEPVCLWLERSAEMIPAILGVWLAGAVLVPLDPQAPEERLADILADLGDPLVVLQPGLLAERKLALKRTLEVQKLFRADSSKVELPRLGATDAAFIIYTSGSTGKPKGVVVEHGAMSNLAAWVRGEIYSSLKGRAKEAWIPPYYFDASLHGLLGALTGGHELQVVDEETRRDPAALLAFLRSQHSDVANTTPTMFSAMLEALGNEAWPGKVIILGAEAIPHALIQKLYANPANREVVVYNLYGPTEACVEVAWHRMALADWNRYIPIPIGLPVSGAELRLLNAQGKEAAVGAEGEICILGVPLARGYHNRLEETQKAFVADPENPAQRMYRTGDIGRRLSDGSIVFAGRKDRQLKIRGFRIEPGEIEGRLAALPGVSAAAVLPVDQGGDKGITLAACVASDQKLDGEALRQSLAASLPAYMIPSQVLVLPRLPQNANNKLDERALLKLLAEASAAQEAKRAPFAPANEVEGKLAEIWRETLEAMPTHREQSFFDAGGNSLAAMRFAGRVRARFGCELKIRELYESPAFCQIAARLDGGMNKSATQAAASEAATPAAMTDEEKALLGL